MRDPRIEPRACDELSMNGVHFQVNWVSGQHIGYLRNHRMDWEHGCSLACWWEMMADAEVLRVAPEELATPGKGGSK